MIPQIVQYVESFLKCALVLYAIRFPILQILFIYLFPDFKSPKMNEGPDNI